MPGQDQNSYPLPEVTTAGYATVYEVPGSGKVHFTRGGITGTRIYSIPWTDSTTNESWLTQVARFFGDPARGQPPDTFSPELPFLYCLEGSIDVVDTEMTGQDDAGKITYSRVLFTASYGTHDFDETLTGQADVVTLAGQNFGWVSAAPAINFPPPFPTNPDTLTEDVGKILPKGEYKFTRYQVLAPNFYALTSLLGSVNNTPVLGFNRHELLLTSFDGRRSYLPNGLRVWDLSFAFLVNQRPGGHLALYRPETGGQFWYFGTLAQNPANGGHDFAYTLADFSPIFSGF